MGQGLEGIKVIELGGRVSAPMAGKMLADLGATVVKIEPPAGEPGRHRGPFPGGKANPEASGEFLALNSNKRSLVLDLATPEGQQELEGLVGEAHVLLHDLTPPEMEALRLDYDRFAARHPGLVMVSLTPYGLTGPYRDYAAADLTLFHGCGWGFLCPGPGSPADQPPIKPFGQHALIQSGYSAAMAAAAGVFSALETGVGEHIDLSIHAIMVHYSGVVVPSYSYAERVDTRLGKRRSAPSGFFRCQDSRIFITCLEEDQWHRLVALMGHPEWSKAEQFATRELRAEHEPEMNEHLNAWTAAWLVEDLFKTGQENRICMCPIFDYDMLRTHEQLAGRGFIVETEHPVAGRLVLPGAPAVLKNPWWALRSPPPLLGELDGEARRVLQDGRAPLPSAATAGRAASGRLLEGVRVLDFTWVWAGPYCGLLLSFLGAEVIKVEAPNRPDLARRANLTPKGMERHLNRSGQFHMRNLGKKSLGLNLSDPVGLALLQDLVPKSDVVVSNFSVGVMERLGLGLDVLHGLNPELVVGAISGFGQTGPCRQYIGYGAPVTALSGISAATGFERDGLPAEVGSAYGDPVAGAQMAFMLVAALVARQLHGGGQYVDMSLWEGLVVTGWEGWVNHLLGGKPHTPAGNHDPTRAPHNVYRCAGEDNWVAIAVVEEPQWKALCRALERPDLGEDRRLSTEAGRKAHEAEVDQAIAAWCLPQDRWAVTERLQAAGVPAFPSVNGKDLVEDPQHAARDFFVKLNHSDVGARALPGIPWLLTRRPNDVQGPAPDMGEHSDEVLARILGLKPDHLARLHADGVLGP